MGFMIAFDLFPLDGGGEPKVLDNWRVVFHRTINRG
jgi:hypothetical protein